MNQDSASGSGVRRLRERLRASTASEILSAAEKVFAERGFFETHMADIASLAGVAVGTLYNHYKDRDALLSALVALRRSELLQRLDETLVRIVTLPFREQLRATLLVIFTHFEEHFQIFSTLSQGECGPPIMSVSSKAVQAEIYQRFNTLIERGRQQLKPQMATLAPALLMGMTRSMLIRNFYVPEEGSPLQHIDTLIDFFFDGADGRQSPAGKTERRAEPSTAPKSEPDSPSGGSLPKRYRNRRERSTLP